MPSVLVLNAGSSSLKYSVVESETGTTRVRGVAERLEETGHAAAVEEVVQALQDHSTDDLVAVGHRVVHGGDRFTEATRLDDEVVTELAALSELAPLHNPPAVTGIHAARAAWPDLPHVASFDTAWFATLPQPAATYAIDVGVAHDHGIRRYGMHGLSHQYVAAQAAQALGRDLAKTRLVTLHIGNGASAAAVDGGRPVDTSMGLTPLEGLVMGTRPGDLDAGVLLRLLRQGWSTDRLEDLLHHHSGLKGLAGSGDARDLELAMNAGDPAAKLAHDIYCHRIRKYVGAYLAVLGGADAVVFTAGVGEHSPRIRGDSLRGLETLGIELDPQLNAAAVDGLRLISRPSSPTAVLVIPTDEELVIAREASHLLAGPSQ